MGSVQMQWLIQCTDLPDTHTLRLLEVVKEKALPHFGIGVVHFTHEITGLGDADPNLPSMFYGSIQLLEKISTWNDFRPGAYYAKEWYDPRNWLGKRADLLNDDIQEITVASLRSKWVDEPMFIKSVDPKALTGMVIEPVKEDQDNWLLEQSHLDGDVILSMSSAKNIELECRFFVVNGKLISGSTYRWLGCRTIRRPIDNEMQQAASEAIKGWLPSRNIVIDICRMRNGAHRIVEFNSLNSSGFYNADVAAIVTAIEANHG
jgi:ATP-grasp domain-containing protein